MERVETNLCELADESGSPYGRDEIENKAFFGRKRFTARDSTLQEQLRASTLKNCSYPHCIVASKNRGWAPEYAPDPLQL